MTESKEKKISFIWAGVSVLSLFIFFYIVHPQIILDFDDWSCITTLRLPFPFFNYWNPSRVLPEMMYPLCGFISGLICLIFPSLGIIRAVSLVTAFVLTLIVFLYEYLMMLLLRKCFNISIINSQLFSLLFILLHFTFFRSSETSNIHLFRTTNITCCYYYLIPAIVNCCMVMYLSIHNKKPIGKIRSFAFYLCLYLSIFSNQFASIILVSYAFLMLIIDAIRAIDSKKQFHFFLKEESTYVIIGFMYVFSLFADGMGGRGRYSSSTDSFIDFSLSGLPPVSTMMKNISPLIYILFAIFTVLFVVYIAKHLIDHNQSSIIIIFFLCMIMVFILLNLLCARVNPEYILRAEVFFGIGFFALCIIIFIVSILSTKIKHSSYVIVLVLILVTIYTNTPGKTFLDSYCEDIDSNTCFTISESLVAQVKDAVDENKSSVQVYVLESTVDPGSNWPQHVWLSDYLPRMLKLFWVIDKSIDVEIVPDSNLNNYYGVSQW